MNTEFVHQIEQWYAREHRDLPWRNTRDPYRIWLSEIILQQTRVVQGYDYYLRFLERFPTVEALAASTEDEVLLQWQGLGYYSRARNLFKAAGQIVGQGGFPRDYAGIRALSGVGDYTAAAIASFAYGLPYAVLDGNVYRVLSRYFGIDTPIDTTQGKRVFMALAQEMLDEKDPALYNQAIMDFGAVVCTPSSPGCSDCPLCERCVATAEGRVSQLPVKAHKTAVTTRHLIYIYARVGDEILLHRRGKGDIWQGLYEPLVMEEGSPQDSPRHPLLDVLLEHGATLKLLQSGKKHQLTHRLLLADFYLLEIPKDMRSELEALMKEHLPEGYILIPESERSMYAVPRLVEDLFRLV